MPTPLIVFLCVLPVFVLLGMSARPVWTALRRRRLNRALGLFRLQRESLEAKFFDLASRQGRPRGLSWLDCDWQNRVTFGRDRKSGLLTAFVSVNISFEAIEGSDMEDVEAVGMIRDAAALFHYERGRWATGGRALFNMDPVDALELLQDQYAPIELSERRDQALAD